MSSARLNLGVSHDLEGLVPPGPQRRTATDVNNLLDSGTAEIRIRELLSRKSESNALTITPRGHTTNRASACPWLQFPVRMSSLHKTCIKFDTNDRQTNNSLCSCVYVTATQTATMQRSVLKRDTLVSLNDRLMVERCANWLVWCAGRS